MPKTEKKDTEDLDGLREEVAKLREKVLEEKAAAEAAARSQDDAIAEAQLLAEKTRLENELHATQQLSKTYQSKSGAVSAPLSAARDAMKHAEEQRKAAEAASKSAADSKEG